MIKDCKDRVAFLKAQAGVPVFDAKLEDLLPKPSKQVRNGVRNAQLVLITSQEIDELCEQDNITQARRQMDGVLNDLRRGFRVLSDLGITSIVFTADHGHLPRGRQDVMERVSRPLSSLLTMDTCSPMQSAMI